MKADSQSLAKRSISVLGVIEPPPIHVSTPTFDGSLALLFTCVRDHKIDLREIPLFPVCEAYYSYLLALPNRDLDESASALAALSYLLERKAWFLLPTTEPEPEMEEAAELPEPTIHEFDLVIAALEEWRTEREHLFFRTTGSTADPYEIPFELEHVSVADLAREFEKVLRHAEPEPFESPSKPRLSIQEQMRLVLLAVNEEWQSLVEILPMPITRETAVYWFLALLELLRLGQISATWSGDDIVYSRRRA